MNAISIIVKLNKNKLKINYLKDNFDLIGKWHGVTSIEL